jgi:hypothetical protein
VFIFGAIAAWLIGFCMLSIKSIEKSNFRCAAILRLRLVCDAVLPGRLDRIPRCLDHSLLHPLSLFVCVCLQHLHDPGARGNRLHVADVAVHMAASVASDHLPHSRVV